MSDPWLEKLEKALGNNPIYRSLLHFEDPVYRPSYDHSLMMDEMGEVLMVPPHVITEQM